MYRAFDARENNFFVALSFVARGLEAPRFRPLALSPSRATTVGVRRFLNVFALALLALTKIAQAEPGRAAPPLQVERAPDARDCADAAELLRRVAQINAKGEAALPRALRIEVRFFRSARELVAEVTTSGPKPGQRTLRDVGPSCDALSGGVAVAIALLLDELEHEQSAPATRSAEPKPTTPEPLPSSPVPAVESVRLRLAAELGGGYGLGGNGTALGLLRVGVQHGALRLDVAASATWPRTSGFDTGELRTSLVYGSARACWLLGHAIAIGPCLQLGAGRLRGVGVGYGETRTANLLWTAAGLGLGAEVPLEDGWRATLGATLWLPLERHTFSVQNRGTAWESAKLAGILSAGLELDVL